MFVCDGCRQQIGSNQPEGGRPFPAYTFLGGLLSAAGAVATGIWILVPAGIVVGALTDSSKRRCEICNSEVGQDEPAFHLMEELGDDLAGRSYRPVGKPTNTEPAHQQQPSETRPLQAPHPGSTTQQVGTQPQRIDQGEDHASEPVDPTFQEKQGLLVRTDMVADGGQEELGLSGDFANDPDPDLGTRPTSGLDSSIAGPTGDGFVGFDDLATEIDVPEWFDCPPTGDGNHE